MQPTPMILLRAPRRVFFSPSQFIKGSVKLCYHYILNALCQSGWLAFGVQAEIVKAQPKRSFRSSEIEASIQCRESRTWSEFVFLCFSRLYMDTRVGHPRLDGQNDTLPEWLRGSPAKWVVFDRRGSNPLGVVRNMGYWRNWKRASLARTRYWDRNPDTPNFCSHGLVGYDARLTRERSRVQVSVRIFFSCFKINLVKKPKCGNGWLLGQMVGPH